MSAPLQAHVRARQLWYWISLRMIALALLATLLVAAGMWLRFFWWEARLRERIPDNILNELKRLEIDPHANAERLRQIYGQYLYGDYFTPEVLQADLLWFSLLVLIALPLIIGVGLMLSLRLSRHLDAVAVAARRIAAGDFSARALSSTQVPAALDDLMRDVNEMAERLERRERELHASSAAIAHELRTPLTAAKARLQGIMDGIFDSSPQQFSMIMRQLDQLNRLISDLYLLSLVSAGQLALVRSQFLLRPLLEERLAWAAPSLRQLPMSTALYCAEHLPLNADRDRLGQAISILIDNALRYAANGKLLSIRAGLRDGLVQIDVEDDGPGFAPEHLELACDRFWRAEHSRSRHAGGSGLGLAVAIAICEAHGGTLSVHNRPAGGARMHLELPAEAAAPQGIEESFMDSW